MNNPTYSSHHSNQSTIDYPRVALAPAFISTAPSGFDEEQANYPPPIAPPAFYHNQIRPSAPPKQQSRIGVFLADILQQQEEEPPNRNSRIYLLCRVLLIAMYVCMLMVTTLSVVTYIASMVIPTPAPDTVLNAIESISEGSKQMSNAYSQCVEETSKQCEATLLFRADLERHRVDNIREANKIKIDTGLLQYDKCTFSLSTARNTIHEVLVSGGSVPFRSNNAQCTQDDRDAILALASGEAREGRQNARDSFERMRNYGQLQATIMARHLEDLFEYNKEYFLGELIDKVNAAMDKFKTTFGTTWMNEFLESIGNAVDVLLACTSVREDGASVCPFPSASFLVNTQIIQVALAQIRSLRDQISLIHERVKQLVSEYTQALGILANLSKFIKAIEFFPGVKGALSRFNVDVGALLGFPNANVILGDIFELPPFDGLPSLSEIWNKVSDALFAFNSAMKSAANRLKQRVEDGIDSVKAAIHEQFEDYNPPAFPGYKNTDSSEKISNDISATFNQLATEGIESVQDIPATTDLPSDDTVFVPPTINQNFTSDTELSNIPTPLEWSFPDLTPFRKLLSIFRFLQKFAIVFQIGMYLFKPVKFWYKTWRATAAKNLPVADMTNDLPTNAEARSMKFLGFFFNVPSLTAILVAFLLAAGMIFGYTQYYPVYRERCMINRKGSYIAAGFLRPFLVNTMLAEGNTAIPLGHASLGLLQTEQCADIHKDGLFDIDQETLFRTRAQEHNDKSVPAIDQLLRCIDFEALPNAQSELANELLTCGPIDSELDIGGQNCNWSNCKIDCGAKEITEDANVLLNTNLCLIEWDIQARFAQLIFIFFISWCTHRSLRNLLNCILILKSEYFEPGVAVVKRLYNEDGQHLSEAEKARTEEKVEEAVKEFKKGGYMQLLQAVLMNISWICIWLYLFITGKNLFKPEWL